MGILYNNIASLCTESGIKAGRLCSDLGLSRGLMTDLKMGRKKSVSAETAAKLADYFKVPINFLLERPPFDIWNQIDSNRKSFILATNLDAELLRVIFKIEYDNPEITPLSVFVRFIDRAIISAKYSSDGEWNIKVSEIYEGQTVGATLRLFPQGKLLPSISSKIDQQKAPTPEDEREIEDPDIRMIARAGKKMSPEQRENLRKYAQYMFPEAFMDDDT